MVTLQIYFFLCVRGETKNEDHNLPNSAQTCKESQSLGQPPANRRPVKAHTQKHLIFGIIHDLCWRAGTVLVSILPSGYLKAVFHTYCAEHPYGIGVTYSVPPPRNCLSPSSMQYNKATILPSPHNWLQGNCPDKLSQWVPRPGLGAIKT